MSDAFDNRLRPVVGFLPGAVAISGAAMLYTAPMTFFPVLPGLAKITALGFACLGMWQG